MNFMGAFRLSRLCNSRCDVNDKPYSAAKLAKRWSISKSTVYEMIRDGRLQSFRLSGQLLRITAEEVARHEELGSTRPLKPD
jgi:excisionase family DNA binding protein